MLKKSLFTWQQSIQNNTQKLKFQELLSSIDVKSTNSDRYFINNAIDILIKHHYLSIYNKKIDPQTPHPKIAFLIDEFDAAFINAKSRKFMAELGRFIEYQFCILKEPSLVQLAYFTGVQQIKFIAGAEINSKFLSELTVCSVFSFNIASYFGFTEKEIDLILEEICVNEGRNQVKEILEKKL